MKITRLFTLILIILLFCNACHKEEASVTHISQEALNTLPDAYNAPNEVYNLGNSTINTAAWAVYHASIRRGMLASTGTLQVVNNNLIYSDQPSDRLIYKPNTGSPIEFSFQQIQGDFSGDDAQFLRNNHQFIFEANSQKYGLMVVSSIKNRIDRVIKIGGPIIINGKGYNVNVQLDGLYKFNVDNTGSEIEIEATYTGTIENQHFKEAVNENWYYHSVYATGNYVAENVSRRFNTKWSVGNEHFQYRDGHIQSVFRDGKPSEWDVNNSPWKAQGELFINDKLYGNLVMGTDNNYIKIWLQSEEQRSEMTKWRLR